jgi:hypothetical protein
MLAALNIFPVGTWQKRRLCYGVLVEKGNMNMDTFLR